MVDIRVPTDLGRPVFRRFEKLPTAEEEFFGVVPPDWYAGGRPQLWRVKGDLVSTLDAGVTPALFSFWTDLPPGSDPLDRIRRKVDELGSADWVIEPLNLPLGRYFSRIARPILTDPNSFPAPYYGGLDFAHERASASIQIAALADRLRMCFQVVDPVEPNFDVFGAEFRSVLLLAATECEAQFKGILRENHYPAEANRSWTTRDYVKVEPALRLGDYAIEFPEYPWLKPIAPFRGWDNDSPSRSLRWYDAYNMVKHDREVHADSAKLIHALEAVSATVVLGVAQFGINFVRSAARWRDLFQIYEHPRWSIGDVHHRVHDRELPGCGTAIDYPFG